MRKRSNINNFSYFNTCSVNSTDSRFTAITRPFHISFYFSQSEVKSDFCTILSGHLSGIRSVFL